MDCLVLAALATILLHTAACCNDFRDFCDEADLPFPELAEAGAEVTSLASLMDTRLGSRQRRMQRRLDGTITPLANRYNIILVFSVAPMYAKKEAGRKVTETLDLLFADSYDRRFRPGFGSGPTDIEVTIFTRYKGPVFRLVIFFR